MDSAAQTQDRPIWWLYLVQGVLGIGLGLLIVIWPKETLTILIGLTGMFLLLGGAVGLIIACAALLNRLSWGWSLAGSLVGTVAGVVLLKWPAPSILIFSLMLGMWAVTTGLLGLASAVVFHVVIPHAWILAAASLCSLVYGIILLVIPSLGLSLLIYLTGGFVIATGVLMSVAAFRVRRWGRSVAHSGRIVSFRA